MVAQHWQYFCLSWQFFIVIHISRSKFWIQIQVALIPFFLNTFLICLILLLVYSDEVIRILTSWQCFDRYPLDSSLCFTCNSPSLFFQHIQVTAYEAMARNWTKIRDPGQGANYTKKDMYINSFRLERKYVPSPNKDGEIESILGIPPGR